MLGWNSILTKDSYGSGGSSYSRTRNVELSPFFCLCPLVCSKPLEIIYSDLWGPSPVVSSGGFKYYLSFIDLFSRFTWLYLLKSKTYVITSFKHFKAKIELQLDCKIKCFQGDGRAESSIWKPIFDEVGIIFQNSCPFTPQWNGLIEIKHCQTVEVGLTLLAQFIVPLKFWDYAFLFSSFTFWQVVSWITKSYWSLAFRLLMYSLRL